jgi:hypothetical protein
LRRVWQAGEGGLAEGAADDVDAPTVDEDTVSAQLLTLNEARAGGCGGQAFHLDLGDDGEEGTRSVGEDPERLERAIHLLHPGVELLEQGDQLIPTTVLRLEHLTRDEHPQPPVHCGGGVRAGVATWEAIAGIVHW